MDKIFDLNSAYTQLIAKTATGQSIDKNAATSPIEQNDSFKKNTDEDVKYFFPNGISNMIVHQGVISNCQSLAALDALSRNPKGAEILRNMVRKNPDGESVDVYFACMEGKPINVKLDEIKANIKDENNIWEFLHTALIENTFCKISCGISHGPNKERPLGVRAIEAAYAKYMKMSEPDKFKDDKVKSVYNNEQYHSSSSRFMEDITGLSTKTIISYDYSKKNEPNHPALDTMDEEKKNEIINIFKEAAQNPDDYALTACAINKLQRDIVIWHDYSIRKVDMQNNTLTIANPWDTAKTQEITIDRFMKSFESLSCTKFD